MNRKAELDLLFVQAELPGYLRAAGLRTDAGIAVIEFVDEPIQITLDTDFSEESGS